MHVVILNWNGGENDPFTAFNAVLAKYFEESGKLTRLVEVSDDRWPSQLLDLKVEGIDFVFTWQGIGTRMTVGSDNQSFWDFLGVPLITIHGDHPCHMPPNNALESRHCAHLYARAEFSLYASRHFRRRTRAITLEQPLFCLDTPLGFRSGDHFVVPKNITPPAGFAARWKAAFPARQFEFYMAATETLRHLVETADRFDVHAVLDEHLAAHGYPEFDARTNPEAFHSYHSQLELFLRGLRSELVIRKLRDVPLQIIGSGWEPYVQGASKHHQFLPARNLAFNQRQYYSNYGIIDICPSLTGLHDRSFRAMRNQTPFLASGHLPEFLPSMEPYDPLFFTFNGDDLRAKCEAVMAHPEEHAELAREFSFIYQSRVRPADFVWKVDSIARALDRR